MDLWIRSQDKMQFHKVNDVFIAKLSDVETGKWGVFVNHSTFGYYKTEERAMEVLDEIEKLLDQQIMNFIDCPIPLDCNQCLEIKKNIEEYGVIPTSPALGKVEYIAPSTVVYKMPQE